VRHIELLSGQPAQTVLRLLHNNGVQTRGAGGRSPFLRRWRTRLPRLTGSIYHGPRLVAEQTEDSHGGRGASDGRPR
jgi:hypothetical protein